MASAEIASIFLEPTVLADSHPACVFDGCRRQRLCAEVRGRIQPQLSVCQKFEQHLTHGRRRAHGLWHLRDVEALVSEDCNRPQGLERVRDHMNRDSFVQRQQEAFDRCEIHGRGPDSMEDQP
jgi:hypothetical protein